MKEYIETGNVELHNAADYSKCDYMLSDEYFTTNIYDLTFNSVCIFCLLLFDGQQEFWACEVFARERF